MSSERSEDGRRAVVHVARVPMASDGDVRWSYRGDGVRPGIEPGGLCVMFRF